MKTALTLVAALFLCAVSFISSAAEPEKMFFQKANVTLVVMLARDNCCNHTAAVKAVGWEPIERMFENRYKCYLTIGEVDVALACYQGQNPGRIGTRVVDINLGVNSCPTDIVSQLARSGVDNIIRDFKRNGYPDGCNADGCGGGGSSSE